MTTLTPDPWATLPPDWNTPKQHVPPPPYTPTIPQWDKAPETTCHPTCARCHHPEGRGLCTTCVMVCDHTRQRRNRTPVLVCLPRTRAIARTARSPGGTGRAITVVDNCPHCHHSHVHSGLPDASPYRISPCGHPYLLEIT